MHYIIFISFVIVLNAFSLEYPFNMSQKEYLSLSSKEKLRSWEKQAAVKESFYNYTVQYEPNNEVYDLYTKQQNKLIITISQGHFKYMKKGYYIPPFSLVKYEVKRVPVYTLKNNTLHHYIWVTYQDIGLYLGIKPHKQHERKNQYISMHGDYFNKLTYDYKPAVIIKNKQWRKGVNKKVSFNGRYNATNINVRIELNPQRKRINTIG